jgi:hypothetical protein
MVKFNVDNILYWESTLNVMVKFNFDNIFYWESTLNVMVKFDFGFGRFIVTPVLHEAGIELRSSHLKVIIINA